METTQEYTTPAVLFDTYEEAYNLSNGEAIRRGCHGTTKFWWSIVQTNDDRFAVLVGDDTGELDANDTEVLPSSNISAERSKLHLPKPEITGGFV